MSYSCQVPETHTVKPDKTKLTIARMVDSGKFNTNPWNKQFLFLRRDQHKLSIPQASVAWCQYWCISTEGSAASSSVSHLLLACCQTELSVIYPFNCQTGDRWEATENNGSYRKTAWIHARLNSSIYPSYHDSQNGMFLIPAHADSNTAIHKSSMKPSCLSYLSIPSVLMHLGCSSYLANQLKLWRKFIMDTYTLQLKMVVTPL